MNATRGLAAILRDARKSAPQDEGQSSGFYQDIVSDCGDFAIFCAAGFIAAKIFGDYQP
jgi:hypothetical protein